MHGIPKRPVPIAPLAAKFFAYFQDINILDIRAGIATSPTCHIQHGSKLGKVERVR